MAAATSTKVVVSVSAWTALATGKANVHLQALGSNTVRVCFAASKPNDDADPGSFSLNAEHGPVEFKGMDAAQNCYAKAVLGPSHVAVLAY